MTKVLLSVYALHHIMFTMSWVSYVALTLHSVEEFSCPHPADYMCYISMKSIVDGNENTTNETRYIYIIERPQLMCDYPLNLSILLRGGKETKWDSLSNGE